MTYCYLALCSGGLHFVYDVGLVKNSIQSWGRQFPLGCYMIN